MNNFTTIESPIYKFIRFVTMLPTLDLGEILIKTNAPII